MLVLPVSGLSERGRKRERDRTGRRTPQASSAPSCDSAGCRTRRPAPMGVPSPRSGGVDQRSTTAATRYAQPYLAWLCSLLGGATDGETTRKRPGPPRKPKAQVSTNAENESRLAHRRRSGFHAQSLGGCLVEIARPAAPDQEREKRERF